MTVNYNAKGGMDSVEFEKHLKEFIYPLYPNTADVWGLQVLIIADSGPGCCNKTMLAWLRSKGVYL